MLFFLKTDYQFDQNIKFKNIKRVVWQFSIIFRTFANNSPSHKRSFMELVRF